MSETKTPLTSEEISKRLEQIQGWTMQEGKLTKSFDFDDFVGAVRFVDRLTEVAEQQGHHPDLFVTWGKVKVELSTHAAAGITDADFRLAAALDNL